MKILLSIIILSFLAIFAKEAQVSAQETLAQVKENTKELAAWGWRDRYNYYPPRYYYRAYGWGWNYPGFYGNYGCCDNPYTDFYNYNYYYNTYYY